MPAEMRDRLEKQNLKSRERSEVYRPVEEMSAEIRDRLEKIYRPHNVKLCEALKPRNIDLPEWADVC